jgi:hypothetical protein
MVPNARPVAEGDGSGLQTMRSAGQSLQMGSCMRAVDRLVEPHAVAVEHLVRADHDRARMARRHAACFAFGELYRDVGGTRAFGLHGAFDFVLVDARGIGREDETGFLHHRASKRALRGKHKRGSGGLRESCHADNPAFSRRSWTMAMIAADVSSMERRATSMTGHPRAEKKRRASTTSLRTFSRSV